MQSGIVLYTVTYIVASLISELEEVHLGQHFDYFRNLFDARNSDNPGRYTNDPTQVTLSRLQTAASYCLAIQVTMSGCLDFSDLYW